jgi:hypothetical protein
MTCAEPAYRRQVEILNTPVRLRILKSHEEAVPRRALDKWARERRSGEASADANEHRLLTMPEIEIIRRSSENTAEPQFLAPICGNGHMRATQRDGGAH